MHRSFVAAMAEFTAEGRGRPGDDSMIGAELRRWRDRWAAPEVFAEFVAAVRAGKLRYWLSTSG